MTNMKKLSALTLALLMILSISFGSIAFALEEEDGAQELLTAEQAPVPPNPAPDEDPSTDGIKHTPTISDRIAIATPSPRPTVPPKPTATPEPSPTVPPKPTATPEPTPAATPEPTPAATPEPSPAATPEPTPAATPEPSPTATPEQASNTTALSILVLVLAAALAWFWWSKRNKK